MDSKLILILSLFSIFQLNEALAYEGSRAQFNVWAGTDTPEEGEARDGATLVKFGITTKPSNVFRMAASFAYVTGGGLTQGEFAFGPFIYPFAGNGKAPVQPFVFGEAVLGVGTLDAELRTDTGGGFGVGIDFRLAKSWGLSLAIEQHLASESSQRLFLGFHFLKN